MQKLTNLGIISGLISIISIINDPNKHFLKHSRIIYRWEGIGMEI